MNPEPPTTPVVRRPAPDHLHRTVTSMPGARTVLDALHPLGRPLVVGGTVRDALLREAGRPVPGTAAGDLDVELHTGHGVDRVVAALREVGASVVRAGARFEVCKVALDGTQVDVAVVPAALEPDTGFRDASARRDFTVDAVAWDPHEDVLLDAHGGLEDVRSGVLRHTSDRFVEDPLRVLRAVQLVARYGFVVHPDTVALARRTSDRWTEIAPDRVWPELRRLASGDHVAAALEVLHAVDWERHLPELAAVRDVPQDPSWHPEGPVHVHLGLAGDAAARACTADGVTGEDRVVAVLGAVLHDLGKAGDGTQVVDEDGRRRIRSLGHEVTGAEAARALLRRVGAPRSVTERIARIVREHMVPHSTGGAAPTVPAARRLLRRLGGTRADVDAWARVCAADVHGRGSTCGVPQGVGTSTSSTSSTRLPDPVARWLRVLTSDAVLGRRTPLLTGRDLLDAGLAPGPAFRAVLDAATAAQDDGVFDDVDGARRWLAAHIAER
ncbi:HD domain-containing protein [Curtobacterium sp. MCBA15_012]|uniref:HD domain-containing protein n=1 Tax=Curtobacterium sp. MCBA15_012 TaxID=1898738 RepID=UPI0008DE7AC8|nr:HD domain-containing protein [Curtobacterium sp. MCBA15_012]WIA98632.1 HD domain-containing protein [Curtobacterium sp. MCBA15_012]